MKSVVLLMVVALAVPAGCSSDKDENPVVDDPVITSTTAASISVPDVVGKDLQLAQDTLQAAGLYNLVSHDSTGQERLQVLDRNWEVTDQTPAAGALVAEDQRIDLGARKFTD